ncbi:MAG: acetoacetate decarboxylase family protein [Prevotellaceae bacterium]|nr:acetoacetate decarboxylase family protein [Prevotellaceae bacterium]
MSERKKSSEKIYEFRGNGYVLFYRFEEEFIRLETFLPENLKNNYSRGLGAVLYMNYTKSPIGPYEELIFIPGKFNYRGKKNHFISKSYVSTEEAVKFGNENWFIPKEKADFSRKSLKNSIENISMYVNNEEVACFELKKGKFKFKIGTSKYLFFSLMQLKGEEPVKLNYSGSVTANFAKLTSIRVRPAFFPNIAQFSPFVAFKMKNFTLRLPNNTQKED